MNVTCSTRNLYKEFDGGLRGPQTSLERLPRCGRNLLHSTNFFKIMLFYRPRDYFKTSLATIFLLQVLKYNLLMTCKRTSHIPRQITYSDLLVSGMEWVNLFNAHIGLNRHLTIHHLQAKRILTVSLKWQSYRMGFVYCRLKEIYSMKSACIWAL